MAVKLSPTSYLVLGLVRMLGQATPYDLKHAVARTVGNMWSFPHTQLYAEPERLSIAGLLSEEREEGGRRRRTFRITPAGNTALQDWLARPEDVGPTEIRDLGLLRLFFAGLGTDDDVQRLARRKLDLHRARLAGYEQAARHIAEAPPQERLFADGDDDRIGRYRNATLDMGTRFERLAVEFWEDMLDQARP